MAARVIRVRDHAVLTATEPTLLTIPPFLLVSCWASAAAGFVYCAPQPPLFLSCKKSLTQLAPQLELVIVSQECRGKLELRQFLGTPEQAGSDAQGSLQAQVEGMLVFLESSEQVCCALLVTFLVLSCCWLMLIAFPLQPVPGL